MEGLDDFETFAPTCRAHTVTIVPQKMAKQGHVILQFDVKKAFLHSTKEEEVYLNQPAEFVKQGLDEEKLVCHLNEAINGLEQDARQMIIPTIWSVLTIA